MIGDTVAIVSSQINLLVAAINGCSALPALKSTIVVPNRKDQEEFITLVVFFTFTI